MFDVAHLIETGGLLLVGLIIFAETGLLVGFFLPGDTLLFTAGFFAAQGKLHIGFLLPVVVVAAILGNNVGYEIGHRLGKRIFKKKDGILFREEHVEKAEKFYEAHGGKTIILARFIPVVRTFSAVVAGVGSMPRRRFFLYNVVGAALWCIGVTMLGFWLGSRIPNIDKYLLPVMAIAVIASSAPSLYHVFKEPKTRKLIWQKVTRSKS